jgi:DHA3 family tetracycline resistance protein-like MFS transporter
VRRLPATTVYYGLELALSLPAFTVAAVYFVRDVHMSPFQLVITGTVMEATVFVSEIPTGAFADVYGRRLSVIGSLVLQGVAWIVVGAVPVVWAIWLAWALWGLAYTFQSGAFEAWLVDEVGVDRAAGVFLRGQRFAYAGSLVGLAASVAIALESRQAAVIAGGVVIVGAGIACLFVMPETGFARRAPEARAGAARELASAARAGARYVRVQPLLLLILVAVFFAGMSSEAFDRLWEAHFIRDVGLPSIGSLDPVVWFGLFGAAMLLVGLLASTVLVHRFDAAATPRLARGMFWFTAALMGGQLVFALAGSLALALGALLIAQLARSLIRPLYMAWLNRQIHDSSVRATVISISGQADAIGEAGGGPFLGLVGNAWGIRAALATGAALLVGALGLWGKVVRDGGEEPELETLPAPETA